MKNTTNKDFPGSLHACVLDTYIDLYFKDFFQRHKISKDQSIFYKNAYAELFIGPSDHRYIDLTFRKAGTEKWFKLNVYLEARFGENTFWSDQSDKYTYSNLDELAEAFIKLHAAIVGKYLNEPFENDFTWEEKYMELQSDAELREKFRISYPKDTVLYKMYFDRKLREEWRLKTKEKLGIKN